MNTTVKKQLTPQERKAFAKQCTTLAKQENLPFELVLLYKKDVDRVKKVIEICGGVKLEDAQRTAIKEGGSHRVSTYKTLGIPFKGVNVDKLDLIELGLLK